MSWSAWFEKGTYTALCYGPRRVPLRLHWSLPLGAFLWTGGVLQPRLWLAFVLLIFFHELGHALAVRWAGAKVDSLDLHGLGGACRWHGQTTKYQRSVIAFAGVWAQGVLLVAAIALRLGSWQIFGESTDAILHLYTWTNLKLALLNLLPIPPLDGAEAWNLFDRLRYRRMNDKLIAEVVAAQKTTAPPPPDRPN